MANGTPSSSIPLGSELLTAMGDIQGAAKAMKQEAIAAKADARSVQQEYKKVEKEAKKANDAIDRLKRKGGTVSVEQQKARDDLENELKRKQVEVFKKAEDAINKDVKFQLAKEKIKAERDMVKNLNQYERRVNGKLLGVRDSMLSVGSKLQNSNIPALQRLGQSIGDEAATINQARLAGITQAGGLALRAAGIAGAGVAGGFAVASVAQRAIRRNVEETQIRGEISDLMTGALRSLSGKANTGMTANIISAGFKTEAERARKQIASESILGRAIGTTGSLQEFIGLSKSAAEREKVLSQIFLDDRRLSEKFGADLANNLNLQTLEKSKSVRDVVKRNVDENITRGVFSRLAGVAGDVSVGGAIGEIALKKYYEVQDAEAINAEARKQRAGLIEGIKKQMEADKLMLLRDPQGASRRKQNALRDQSLEAERIRRNMQTARF